MFQVYDVMASPPPGYVPEKNVQQKLVANRTITVGFQLQILNNKTSSWVFTGLTDFANNDTDTSRVIIHYDTQTAVVVNNHFYGVLDVLGEIPEKHVKRQQVLLALYALVIFMSLRQFKQTKDMLFKKSAKSTFIR